MGIIYFRKLRVCVIEEWSREPLEMESMDRMRPKICRHTIDKSRLKMHILTWKYTKIQEQFSLPKTTKTLYPRQKSAVLVFAKNSLHF